MDAEVKSVTSPVSYGFQILLSKNLCLNSYANKAYIGLTYREFIISIQNIYCMGLALFCQHLEYLFVSSTYLWRPVVK